MPQFGAATVITGDTRLILLDCFETLVELDGSAYRARKGVPAFLDHFAPKAELVVVSDAEEKAVIGALVQAGIAARIRRIYHAGNAIERDANGRIRKRLDVPLRDYKLEARAAVFIGDSPLDAEAARRFQVPFIRVPRSEDRTFTFTILIAGPSRYDSSEFSATFLEQYVADRKTARAAPPGTPRPPGELRPPAARPPGEPRPASEPRTSGEPRPTGEPRPPAKPRPPRDDPRRGPAGGSAT